MNAEGLHAEQQDRANIQSLIDASPVGVIVFDAMTQDVISFNEESWRLLNDSCGPDATFEELIPHLTFWHRDGRAISREDLPMPRVLSTGEAVRGAEIIVILPNGKSVPALINAAPIFSEEGEITEVVVAFHDMTRFEEMERLRAQFLDMISHELRGALKSIKETATSALNTSRELDAAGMRQLFSIVDEQADHMQSLISDLLDMAQTQSGAR